ncbi:histone acetyltransferase MCC1, putative [Babesia ovata]|uniref:histone acetyltransferase n=1 Tax=Babesia ovata TaxID=189622 RepID=A0A2H6KHY2_9APIC|nr:histone acetyltransferase MCC1, putative [Babesia ovata]GBE62593.1 histone acetyltransferase MCC1, putative [Babesia ovata]
MSEGFDHYRSSALIPGVELWPSEWSALNRTLLGLPKDLPVLRHLRMRPLEPRHRGGLHLLHARLFPIRYDPSFYDTACRVQSKVPLPNDAWAASDMIGIGMFLPMSVVRSHCALSEVTCCESSDSSSSSGSSSRRASAGSPASSVDNNPPTDGEDSDQDFKSPSTGSDTGSLEASGFDCILNDTTYDRENDEFLVGFLTIWINRNIFSSIVSDNDYFLLENFYNDMIFPFLETSHHIIGGTPTSPNFDMLTSDSYRFLFSTLYRNSELLEYLSSFNLNDCKTIYVLSAGVTMGLRSRLLGSHLILFVQCMMYFCCYSVFLYNGHMFHCAEDSREQVLSALDLFLGRDDAGDSLELNDVLESEVAPFRLSASSVLDFFRDCDAMPITIYLHVIGYNTRACSMYRRTNFICVTRLNDFYVINGSHYPANLFAYYLCPPCEI